MNKPKLSKTEILRAAASDVLRVMDVNAIEPKLNEADEERFTEFFVERATKLLEDNERIDLAFGPNVTRSGEFFSDDMKVILQFIEKETKRKYIFRKGQLLIYFTKEFGTGIWLED